MHECGEVTEPNQVRIEGERWAHQKDDDLTGLESE
jgi:hypothetical protein